MSSRKMERAQNYVQKLLVDLFLCSTGSRACQGESRNRGVQKCMARTTGVIRVKPVALTSPSQSPWGQSQQVRRRRAEDKGSGKQDT